MDTLLTGEEVSRLLDGIDYALTPVGTYTPPKGKPIQLYSGAEVAKILRGAK